MRNAWPSEPLSCQDAIPQSIPWPAAVLNKNKTIPNPLPVTFLRGGTSKGIAPRTGRQLDGMSEGVSIPSKINVVGPPLRESIIKPSIDLEYTFVQVGI